MCPGPGRVVVVRDDGHSQEVDRLDVIRVDVREIGKVDCGTVVDCLEGAAGVEVPHALGWCYCCLAVLRSGTFRPLEGRAESSGAHQLVCAQTSD